MKKLEKELKAAGSSVPFALGETVRVFIDGHEALITAIGDVLAKQQSLQPVKPEGPPGDLVELRLSLEQLRGYLETEEPRPCKKILGALLQKKWPESQEDFLVELDRLVSNYRLAEALVFLEKECAGVIGIIEEKDNE